MSSLILCHKKKAKNAYEIARIHRKIYTIEELCYYLCNYIYLVDYTLMNETLCEWLRDELELKELADKLCLLLEENSSIEQFIITILTETAMYTSGELSKICDVLDNFKNQKPIEKQKFKADSLLESGSVKSAIMAYLEIIHGERDESIDGKFYGKVYGCLGAAYGRQFLYREAAQMYEAAFQICEDKSMLQAYLYACRKYMNTEQYLQLIQKSSLYQQADMELSERVKELEENLPTLHYEDTLSNWKNQYRRISTGEL